MADLAGTRARFSWIAVGCCLPAVAGLVAGLVIATEVAQRFRAGPDTHDVAGAYLAAEIHFAAMGLVIIGLAASLRKKVRHPVALIVTMALPFLCLLAGLSDLYIARQILDTGWTVY